MSLLMSGGLVGHDRGGGKEKKVPMNSLVVMKTPMFALLSAASLRRCAERGASVLNSL